jgi:ribosomal protection tetracycline resistance protein
MRTLNLGILAHVDAGKTSLTERLLHAAGVIDQIGSVDDGTAHTDTLALERERGITIKSAVASFVLDDVTINLIDTPGHPDFIAEVERVLHVLDGVILVISAVEGVQAQTRVLMRALQRLRVATLIFVNKIDRRGADDARLMRSISGKLTSAIVPMGRVVGAGTQDASFERYTARDGSAIETLAAAIGEHDDAILDAYVADDRAALCRLVQPTLSRLTREARLHPVFFGSAMTGAGINALVAQIAELLPASAGDVQAPRSGTVFKVERGPLQEKIAYVRLFSGRVQVRDRIAVSGRNDQRVTRIGVFENGGVCIRDALAAGHVGKLWGLNDVQIGDSIGVPDARQPLHHFMPPMLETAIVPRHRAVKGALHAALAELAEQDPLIDLRQDDALQEIYVSLYGEVQKDVIQATLANDYDLDVEFRETTAVCTERPIAAGEAIEIIGKRGNPLLATLGIRVEPVPLGQGNALALAPRLKGIPLYVYKRVEDFEQALRDAALATLKQGLYGWSVIDCRVTVTACGYISPATSAADYRKLLPLVLMTALARAGTVVCEPIHRFRVEAPADDLCHILPALARLRAVPCAPLVRRASVVLEGDIPATCVHELQKTLPSLTHGEGVLEYAFGRYDSICGSFPTRSRTGINPLDRRQYLLQVARHV